MNINFSDIAPTLKSVFGFVAGRAVQVGEVSRGFESDDYRYDLTIHGQRFMAFVSGRELHKANGREDYAKALGAPLMAIDKVYRDGYAAGRKCERAEEIRQLRTKQENAYRALRHKALADAWNAIASGGQ